MKTIINARLRVPVAAVILGIGSIASVLAAGRWHWGNLLILVALVIGGAVIYYVWGGTDGDMGAMFGGHTDERQDRLRTQARSFSAVVMIFASVVGVMVATALRDPIWPFALFGAIGLVSFLAGLAIFRYRGIA